MQTCFCPSKPVSVVDGIVYFLLECLISPYWKFCLDPRLSKQKSRSEVRREQRLWLGRCDGKERNKRRTVSRNTKHGPTSGREMNGFLRLCEYPGDVVHLSCAKCNRKGPYPKQSLIERFGPDIPLPDLRHEIAQCERHG